MNSRNKAVVIAAGAAIALAAIVTILLVTGVVKLPSPEPKAQEQREGQAESFDAASWQQAEKADFSIKAADIRGIEATDLTEDAMRSLEAALADYAWDHQGFGKSGLSIEQAPAEAGSAVKRYKLTDEASASVFTLKLSSGKWTLTEGYSPNAGASQPSAASPSASSPSSAASQQSPSSPAAQSQAHQGDAQGQAAPQDAGAVSQGKSFPGFDRSAAVELGTQQCADAIGAGVASRLMADVNDYLKATGLQARSASQVKVDPKTKTQKGDVLKFKAVVEDDVYSVLLDCTYDTTDFRHAFVMTQ